MKSSARILILFTVLVHLIVPATFAQKKQTVKLAYVDWSTEVASTNVVKAVLQEKLGYNVEIIPLHTTEMWNAVADGEADALVAAWLPTTHATYLEETQTDVINLGPNLKGTRIGLVVPAYVTINSITELNAVADKFFGQIVGIDPGAGVMIATQKAMEKYGLSNLNLFEGRPLLMTAALKAKIAKKDWVVLTGWTPHWMFSRWELKYLDDPKGIYPGEEHISTVVRKGLEDDMPEVFKFLDQFAWEPADMQQVMAWNTVKDANPYESAKRWIAENPQKVETWLTNVREEKNE